MDLEETGEYESVFLPFFSVERVEFEMAVLKQRKIDGERCVFQDNLTDQYFFIAQRRNSFMFSLLGNNIEYSSSGVDRLVRDVMKCQTSQ